MPDASSPPDLVERLRRVAEQDHICTGSTDCEHCTGDCLCSYFSPEQVARGLAAAIQAVMWCAASHGHAPDREAAIAAFLSAAGANPKEGA